MSQQRHESGGERVRRSETKKRGADRSNSDLPTPHGVKLPARLVVFECVLRDCDLEAAQIPDRD